MFALKIETDNAAFGPDAADRAAELARILRGLADKIEAQGYVATVADINGNKVGTVALDAFNPADHAEPIDASDVDEISGTYGTGKCPCPIYTYPAGNGLVWYAVDGSCNVNCAAEDEICEGVDVEAVEDVDTFTASNPINSAEDMARECQDA